MQGKWPNMKVVTILHSVPDRLQRCSTGELIPSSEIRNHNKKACHYRMVSCTHCNKKTPANMLQVSHIGRNFVGSVSSTLQDHISHCEYQPQPCSNAGCGNLIARSEKMHHEKYTCAFRLVTCHVCKESVVVDQLKVQAGCDP